MKSFLLKNTRKEEPFLIWFLRALLNSWPVYIELRHIYKAGKAESLIIFSSDLKDII